jgi:hypothetical protein
MSKPSPRLQVVKHVSYDTEYGFDLPYKEASPEIAPVTWTHGYLQMPGRMLPNNLIDDAICTSY